MARARRLHTNQLLAVACVVALADTITAAGAHAKTPLKLLESVHLSTVGEDFRGDSAAFSHAIAWHENHLYRSRSPGAHIACAEYGSSLPARSRLVELLAVGCVRPLSNHKEHGACFIVTASPEQAAELRETPAAYGLRLFFPLPSVAKVAPGLLDHGNSDAKDLERLQTTYGDRVRITNNVHGLSLGLSPGVLPSQDVGSVHQWTSNLRSRLMSDSVNLHAANFWSDPAMLEFHEASPEGALRAREWTRAADVVHQLSSKDGPSPAQICSWHGIGIHHISDDHVIITGMILQDNDTVVAQYLQFCTFCPMI